MFGYILRFSGPLDGLFVIKCTDFRNESIYGIKYKYPLIYICLQYLARGEKINHRWYFSA